MKTAHLSEILGALGQQVRRVEFDYQPATPNEVKNLLRLEKPWCPRLGDIVRFRPGMQGMHAIPQVGQEVIVTQVLNPPYRTGDGGTATAADPHDIAIGVVAHAKKPEDGTPLPPEVKVQFIEYLMDSRRFECVGNIYDQAA